MGQTENIIKIIKRKFTGDILDVCLWNNKRLSIRIQGKALPEICKYLHEDMQYRFIIASALETGRGFEIYYHFSDDKTGCVLNLHVILAEENPEVESLTPLFESANWIEREMHEILGIRFLNHPDPEKLISDGNWAEGVYPYRKEI